MPTLDDARDAARTWALAPNESRAMVAQALVDAAEEAGQRTPAAVIHDCHPLCSMEAVA